LQHLRESQIRSSPPNAKGRACPSFRVSQKDGGIRTRKGRAVKQEGPVDLPVSAWSRPPQGDQERPQTGGGAGAPPRKSHRLRHCKRPSQKAAEALQLLESVEIIAFAACRFRLTQTLYRPVQTQKTWDFWWDGGIIGGESRRSDSRSKCSKFSWVRCRKWREDSFPQKYQYFLNFSLKFVR